MQPIVLSFMGPKGKQQTNDFILNLIWQLDLRKGKERSF